jgi:hypothetical protein
MSWTEEQKRLKYNGYMRKWKHTHPEIVARINKKYKEENPDKIWQWQAIGDARWKAQAYLKLGCKCRRCGEANPLVLTLNHINGNGHKDRNHYSTEALCHQVVNGRDDLELLCHNCQKLFEYDRGRLSKARAEIFLTFLEEVRNKKFSLELVK